MINICCEDLEKPVLHHLVSLDVYRKPYLLYCADVTPINWPKSDIYSLCYALNITMCKIFKVKLECLKNIYGFTGQMDTVQEIMQRRERSMHCLQSWNAVHVVRLCTSSHRLYISVCKYL